MEKLHDMMAKGIISAEEFTQQKAELMALAKLEKLHSLLLKGVLTQAEFDAKKAELMKQLL